ncbi:MAG: helix-turn-helix domain-containing protein [Thermodesulfobacteriota bacterium]
MEQHGTTLDEKAAAKFLGLAVQSLRNRRSRRLGPPYVKIGGRVLYLLADLQDFLKKHRIDPEREAR